MIQYIPTTQNAKIPFQINGYRDASEKPRALKTDTRKRMTDRNLEFRRAVMALTKGQSKTLDIATEEISAAKNYIERFARGRQIGIKFDAPEAGRLQITRTENLVSSLRFGEMDGLAIGQSYLFNVHPAEHMTLRRMATYRNQCGDRYFKCTREGDAMRVTRMPMTEAERQSCAIDLNGRQTKYGLEQLETLRELRFQLPASEHDRLRLAVHRKAKQTGWTIRCRLQDDGTMLVYRNDAGAPAADSSLSTITERP